MASLGWFECRGCRAGGTVVAVIGMLRCKKRGDGFWMAVAAWKFEVACGVLDLVKRNTRNARLGDTTAHVMVVAQPEVVHYR